MILQRPRAGKELPVFKEQREGQCAWAVVIKGESAKDGEVASSHIVLDLVSRAFGIYLGSHGGVSK